jgi:hypothetical protein
LPHRRPLRERAGDAGLPIETDMPCLDATALDTDPEGMAFLRSVLKPDAREARPAPAPFPMVVSAVMAAAVARRPAQARRPRRADSTGPAAV